MIVKESPPIPIDLIGDVASAECFIGLRLIDAVVRSVPGLAVEIRWRPFQIAPDLPAEGQDRAAYLEEKGCSRTELREALETIAETGREFGIEFAFDKIRRQPNTFDAHRLIRYARNFGAEIAIVEALFQAFFVDGEDIGNRGALAAIAGRAGVDAELVGAFLEGTDGAETLRRELSEIRMSGVEAVPRFIIAGKETISGIKSPEDFADALFNSIEDE